MKFEYALIGVMAVLFASILAFIAIDSPESHQTSENEQIESGLKSAQQISIELGQTIQLDELELHFYDIEDTRCPLDVVCIWEGNVTVMINIKNQTHNISGYFAPDHTVSYIEPYDVTLTDIQPHPISTEKAEYVATVSILKN